MTEHQPPEVGRWVGMGEALARLALAAAATAVGIGALGALVAWATGRNVASGVTGAYYIVGCLLFIVGMFPTGGFSMIRGTMTRRRPTGPRQEPFFLIGVVLIGLGILVDLTF
jgi:hypothetical protein